MKKVIVVDDNEEICLVLKYFLKEEGYQAAVAYTGREALAKVKQKRFDVMILDVHLPDIDGLRVLQSSHHLQPAMKIIMVSGDGNFALKEKAVALGAESFFEKPFDLKRVRKSLEVLNMTKEVCRH